MPEKRQLAQGKADGAWELVTWSDQLSEISRVRRWQPPSPATTTHIIFLSVNLATYFGSPPRICGTGRITGLVTFEKVSIETGAVGCGHIAINVCN